MRTKMTLMVVSICTGLLLAAPAWAHHAFQAEFDQRKPIKLEGKVTDMEWINPHAWIHIDVKNPDGTVTNWMERGVRQPEHHAAARIHQAVARSGHRYRGAGISGQERNTAGQRQQRHVRGREEAIRRRLESGRSE